MGYLISVKTFSRLPSCQESVCTLFTSLADPQHISLKLCASKSGVDQARFSTDSCDRVPELGTELTSRLCCSQRVQVSLRFIESCERDADYVRTCSWVTNVRMRQRHVYRPHARHQPL